MIRFSHPLLIWLLALLPLLFFFSWRAGHFAKAKLSQFGGWPLNGRLLSGWSLKRFMLKELLLLAALALLLLAAAGPQRGTREMEVKQRGVDVVVAVDVSLSMGAQDLAPDRMARARHSIRQLLKSLKGDRVALVPFAGTAFLQHPLTRDYELSGMMTDLLRPGLLPTPGTDLGSALEIALNTFQEEEENDRVLLILSDGEDFAARWETQLEKARELHVRIYTVGMASPDGAPVPDPKQPGAYKQDTNGSIVLSRLDEATLSTLAASGGGFYQRSTPGGDELIRVLEQIEAMEGREGASRNYTGWQDRYSWFLLPALLFGLLSIALPQKARALLVALVLLPALAKADASSATDRGIEAYQREDWGGSVQSFQEAIQEDAGSRGHFNLGTGLYQSGDLENAEQAFLRSLDVSGEDADTRRHNARALANLGRVQLDQQKGKEAIESLVKALQLDPELESARHNLEWALRQEQENQDSQDSQESGESDESDENQDSSGEQNQDQQEQDQGDQQQQEQQQQQEGEQEQDSGQQQGQEELDPQDDAEQPGSSSEEPSTEEQQAQPPAEMKQLDKEQLEQLLREAARQEKASLEAQLKQLPAPARKVEKDW